MVHIYNGILFSHEKKGNLPFVTMLIDFKDIMPSERNQTKTNTV